MDISFVAALQLLIASMVFVIGVSTFAIGIFILVNKALGKELRTLSSQTARLAQKGLAEDVAGLVGNASALLSAINDLIRTATGIGVFLAITGIVLMLISFWMLLQIQLPIG